MDIEVKKSKPFEDYKPSTIDDSSPIIQAGSDLPGSIQKYQEFSQKYDNENFDEEIDLHKRFIQEESGIILSPKEITSFCKGIIKYDHSSLGCFLGKVVQDSYNSGHNNFVLPLQDFSPPEYLGTYIQGTPAERLEVKVEGNVGVFAFTGVKYGDFKLEGNGKGFFASSAEASNFLIEGNVENNCGSGAKKCDFTIDGNAGALLGEESENSSFHVDGDIGYSLFAHALNSRVHLTGEVNKKGLSTFGVDTFMGMIGIRNCTFETSNKRTLKELINGVPEYVQEEQSGNTIISGNKIIFVNNGVEELVRDYGS